MFPLILTSKIALVKHVLTLKASVQLVMLPEAGTGRQYWVRVHFTHNNCCNIGPKVLVPVKCTKPECTDPRLAVRTAHVNLYTIRYNCTTVLYLHKQTYF